MRQKFLNELSFAFPQQCQSPRKMKQMSYLCIQSKTDRCFLPHYTQNTLNTVPNMTVNIQLLLTCEGSLWILGLSEMSSVVVGR